MQGFVVISVMVLSIIEFILYSAPDFLFTLSRNSFPTLKKGRFFGCNSYFIPGAWVIAGPPLIIPHLEASKTPYLDTLIPFKGLYHTVKNRF